MNPIHYLMNTKSMTWVPLKNKLIVYSIGSRVDFMIGTVSSVNA